MRNMGSAGAVVVVVVVVVLVVVVVTVVVAALVVVVVVVVVVRLLVAVTIVLRGDCRLQLSAPIASYTNRPIIFFGVLHRTWGRSLNEAMYLTAARVLQSQ